MAERLRMPRVDRAIAFRQKSGFSMIEHQIEWGCLTREIPLERV
jgi:hypothetical protein